MDREALLAEIQKIQRLFARAREDSDSWAAGMRALDKWEIALIQQPATETKPSTPSEEIDDAPVERSWLHEEAGL
jgi:hypothetical protein